MNVIDDGGLAFPPTFGPETRKQYNGMSLRDWFAGMALSGLAANQEMLMANKELIDHFGTSGIDKLQANKAYRLADAMIVERSRSK